MSFILYHCHVGHYLCLTFVLYRNMIELMRGNILVLIEMAMTDVFQELAFAEQDELPTCLWNKLYTDDGSRNSYSIFIGKIMESLVCLKGNSQKPSLIIINLKNDLTKWQWFYHIFFTETFYWFGDNNYTEWEEVFKVYKPPPYELPHLKGVYSFGMAGKNIKLHLFQLLVSQNSVSISFKVQKGFLYTLQAWAILSQVFRLQVSLFTRSELRKGCFFLNLITF